MHFERLHPINPSVTRGGNNTEIGLKAAFPVAFDATSTIQFALFWHLCLYIYLMVTCIDAVAEYISADVLMHLNSHIETA